MAKSAVLVVLLVAAVVITTVAQDAEDEGVCDPGWKRFGKNCYFFNTHKTTADCAESICKKSGGHLAAMETKKQEDFIMNLVKADGCPGERRFWVGLNDKSKEGTFTWFSTKKAGQVKSYYPGEPNNYGGNEDCIEVDIRDGKWNDHRCNTVKRCYVCEKKPFKKALFYSNA